MRPSIISLSLLLLPAFVFLRCGGEEDQQPTEPKSLDLLLQKYPDSIPLLVEHGNIMLDSLHFDVALSDASRAFRLDSNRFDVKLLYAKVLNNRPGRSVQDVTVAQNQYTELLKEKPKNLEVMIALASTYSFMQDFDRSFEYLDEALRIDPRYRDAYVMKGTNFLQIGRRDLAKSSYETATQQDPSFWEAYIVLGSLYEADGDPICIEYYTTASQLRPNDPEILYSLAYAYQEFNEPDQAVATYRRMAKLDTLNAMPDFQIGYIHQFYRENIDSAVIYYKQALQLNPEFTEAWHNLGLCYVERKDRPRALEAFSKALKYNPDFELSREEAEKLR